MMAIFEKAVDRNLQIRGINVAANHIGREENAPREPKYEQLDIFTDAIADERRREAENAAYDEERRLQKALIAIKKRYGGNAILKGMDFIDGATARERNRQIGGHRA